MGIHERVTRNLAAIRLLWSQFQDTRRDTDYINWYLQHKRNGIPLNRKSDKDYIDWYYNYRPALLKFANIHKGEDCFIIGNGPSLNQMALDRLNQYHVFGLNKIHLIFSKHPLKLSYHVAVNPLVIEQIAFELESDKFQCESFLTYQNSRSIGKLKNVHKLFADGPWTFYGDMTDSITEGYTVTYVAMQIAFYMGFQNVFLIGVDHNFNQSGKPNEKQKHEGEDINHFHPDYFKGQNWHLADIEGNEASYALARHAFHSAGREIFDATLNGKLQLFKKISFDEALNLAKKRVG